jgi:hypothetical protein
LNAARTERLFTLFNTRLKSHFVPHDEDQEASVARRTPRQPTGTEGSVSGRPDFHPPAPVPARRRPSATAWEIGDGQGDIHSMRAVVVVVDSCCLEPLTPGIVGIGSGGGAGTFEPSPVIRLVGVGWSCGAQRKNAGREKYAWLRRGGSTVQTCVSLLSIVLGHFRHGWHLEACISIVNGMAGGSAAVSRCQDAGLSRRSPSSRSGGRRRRSGLCTAEA